MIKNIGKLKQWTGEKFGSARITLQTEDFHRLEVETERKRVAYEKLHSAVALFNTQLLKRKISPEDNKSKRLPHDIFGVSLTSYGNEVTDESPLGMSCVQFGLAQSKIASYQEEHADMMKAEYMEKLDEGLQQYKEYQALRKKLESRRLDYDAKLGRLQKSKKEKPELEQEMQAAKMKYEDSEYDVIQKMAAIQEFEDEHCEALQHLLELQIEFFTRSLDVLNEAKSNWATSTTTTANRAPRFNSLSLTSSNQSGDMPSRTLTRKVSTETTNMNSNTTSRPTPSHKSSSFADRDDLSVINRATPPPALPRRQSQASPTESRNQRKAVFDFSGDNSDELSFRIGDIIHVVEEVDEGWWIGEIIESDGYTRRGIFPVNYTEASHKSAGPPMPVRPNLSTTTQHQAPEEDSPFSDSSRTAPEKFSYIRGNSQPIRSLSSTTNQPPLISPSQSPIPQAYKSKRTPPPPPPSSRTPPAMTSTRSSNTAKSIRTAPTTPYQQQQDSYFDTKCTECSCEDFSANVFKKGHCNNCFHKHF